MSLIVDKGSAWCTSSLRSSRVTVRVCGQYGPLDLQRANALAVGRKGVNTFRTLTTRLLCRYTGLRSTCRAMEIASGKTLGEKSAVIHASASRSPCCDSSETAPRNASNTSAISFWSSSPSDEGYLKKV